MKFKIRWRLVIYDILILALVDILLLVLYRSVPPMEPQNILYHASISLGCIFFCRFIGGVYKRVWRYGGIQSYIRLLLVDGAAFWMTWLVELVLPFHSITFSRLLSIACMTLLSSLAIRMMYRYSYKYADSFTTRGKILTFLLRVIANFKVDAEKQQTPQQNKINIAIVGAGRLGIALAEEISSNSASPYHPCCFIDVNLRKTGKVVNGLPVFFEQNQIFNALEQLKVREVILAIQDIDETQKSNCLNFILTRDIRLRFTISRSCNPQMTSVISVILILRSFCSENPLN